MGQGVGQAADPHPDPQAETPRRGQTVPESTPLIVLAASRLAEVVTWAYPVLKMTVLPSIFASAGGKRMRCIARLGHYET